MNAQEIFDKAVGGVIRQGNLALVGKSCKYRTPKGLACGVGQLVDDETAKLWDNQSEVHCAGSAIIEIPTDMIPVELRKHMDLMDQIQHAHDTAGRSHHDPVPRLLDFLSRAHRVAKRHELTCSFTGADVIAATGGAA